MSDDNSSITVDQPPPRNDHLERQNGVGQGRQMIPMAPNQRLLSSIAHRTLIIPNNSDIVNVLAALSVVNLQAMYILSGRGFVSEAHLLSLPSREEVMCIGRGKIVYLSGWFQHMLSFTRLDIPSSVNGVLHVSLSDVLQRVTVATSLITSGNVEVDVMFVCRPGSAIQPDAPGGPRVPIRSTVNVNTLLQGLRLQAPLVALVALVAPVAP